MADWVIALYFGFGLLLVQFLHTIHSAGTYGQKQVRALEYLPNFSRADPPTGWERTFRPFKRPLQLPWNAPVYQMDRADVTWAHRLLGLHYTNLYYCYATAVVYGVLGTIVVRFLVPPMTTVTLPALLTIGGTFAVLHFLSSSLVGSGFAITLLEGNLMFNTFILLVLKGDILTYSSSVGLLQFGAALTVAPLVFWLHFQYNEQLLRFGNLFAFYYVLIPVLYSEFFVLALGLLYESP